MSRERRVMGHAERIAELLTDMLRRERPTKLGDGIISIEQVIDRPVRVHVRDDYFVTNYGEKPCSITQRSDGSEEWTYTTASGAEIFCIARKEGAAA